MEQAIAQLAPGDAATVKARLGALDLAMHRAVGHNVRDDSRLAFLWCSGRLEGSAWTQESVIHEMACMQWLCATTTYVPLLQPTLRQIADALKEKFGVSDWTTVWSLVSEYGPDLVKYHSMHPSGLQMPDFAPAPPPEKKKKTSWADLCD